MANLCATGLSMLCLSAEEGQTQHIAVDLPKYKIEGQLQGVIQSWPGSKQAMGLSEHGKTIDY